MKRRKQIQEHGTGKEIVQMKKRIGEGPSLQMVHKKGDRKKYNQENGPKMWGKFINNNKRKQGW